MIIVKTPAGRISVGGGGSDTIQFLREYGHGICISSAIDQFSYTMIKRLLPLHEYSSRVTYSQVECVQHNSQIKHQAFNKCIDFAGLQKEPLEVNYVSDLKGYMGLGTSSSLIIGLLQALYDYKDSYIDKHNLWKKSANVEQTMMGNAVGYQDYLPAIYGNSYVYEFHLRDGWIEPQFIAKKISDKFTNCINYYGLLMYTGIARDSSVTAEGYVNTKNFLTKQKKILSLAEEFIANNDYSLNSIGQLLGMSWLIKREIPGISNEWLNDIYYGCYKLGALGKLLGSGMGGTFFFMVEPDNRQKVIDYCRKIGCVEIPFQVSEKGCHRLQ